MIQSAAPSVSSSLALGVGTQAASGDDAAVSADFAALLESTVTTGPDGVGEQAVSIDPANVQPMRQVPGNAAGKKLPLDLLLAGATATDAALPTDDAAQDSTVGTDTEASPPPAITDIILPGLVLPVSVQTPQAPKAAATSSAAARSTTESLAQTAAAQVIRPALPAAGEIPQPAHSGKTVGTNTATAPSPEAPATATPSHAAAAPDQTMAVSIPMSPRPASRLDQGATATAPTVVIAMPPVDATASSVIVQAASTEPATTAVQVQLQAQAGMKATVGAKVAAKPTEPAPQPSLPENGSIAAAEASASLPVQPAAAPKTGDAQASDSRASATSRFAAETPAAPPQHQPAPTIQPTIAMDVQSFTQSVAPIAATPASDGATATGHDFAALVDRLVEARQAAVPQAIHAAVTHSDFGQVSLRFDQDANGLSVSMTSADPDFANAVQATAASAQSQTANDQGSNAQRHDGQGQQQTAGFASGQSQSQSQSQASARNERNSPSQAEGRQGRTSNQQSQGDEPAAARGGIYA